MKRILLTLFTLGLLTLPVEADEDEFEVLEHEILKLALPLAKVPMKQAIDTAMKEVVNGKLSNVELSLKGETPVFEIAFLTDSGATEVTVDAVTGKVLKKDDEKPDADEAEEYKQTQKALNESKFTLLQAIDVAMKEAKGGTVVKAEAEVEKGAFKFDVELLAGDEFKEVEISSDGKTLKSETEKAEGQAWIFDRDEAGKAPAGWKFGFTNPADGKATWSVTRDADAPSGPNVLTLSARSGDGAFNLAMAEKTSYKDVNVRTRIRANTGKEDQGGGLIWRCKDENNYYICRMNPLENNFRVYKVINGKRQQLQSVKFKTETGKWYVVRAKMVGNHIMCFVGDKKLLDVTDDEIKDAGMVGLWTKADASSSFDNIAVAAAHASEKDSTPKAGDQSKVKEKDEDDDDDDAQPAPKKP